MSLQIQPRALDIENDLNIIQGIILNILILNQQPWRFSAKFWDAAVTTLQNAGIFFPQQLFPRNAWKKNAGLHHLVKKMMWIGFHPGAAAVFRVTIEASKTKKKNEETWNAKSDEMAMCFCFLGFLPGKQSHFSPYKQKFLETLRVLLECCIPCYSLCSCDMRHVNVTLYMKCKTKPWGILIQNNLLIPRKSKLTKLCHMVPSGILATYGSSKQTSHDLFGPLDFQGTDVYIYIIIYISNLYIIYAALKIRTIID